MVYKNSQIMANSGEETKVIKLPNLENNYITF